MTGVSPSTLGTRSTQGAHGCAGGRGTSPEPEPPREKRARRESGEQEVEEGEITDSSDEEEDHAEETNLRDKSFGEAKSSTGDTQVITDERVDQCGDSSRDQCVNQDITGSTDDVSTSTESAESSKTTEEL